MPDSKNSPSNRRHLAGQARHPSKKVYASESDIPSYQPHSDKRTSPSTPRKSLSGGGAPQQGSATTAQKQRNKNNKNRNAKNGTASPGRRQQQDRGSPAACPPETSAPIFAGSTFHASPAPTSLPIPSFLGRSNTDHVANSDTDAAQDISPQTGPDESPTDKAAPGNDESPLEFFFRADRAEKARVRRASSANTGVPLNAPFSPPRNAQNKYNSSPRGIADSSAQRPLFAQRNTSPGMSTSEFDGNDRLPVGPAFSTPYQERIRAAHSTQGGTHPKPIVNRNLDLNSSEALKRYLFTGQLSRSESQGTSSPYSSPTPERTSGLSGSIGQSTQQQQSPFPSQISQHSLFSTPSRPQGAFRGPVLTSYTTQPSPSAPILPGNAAHTQPISSAMNNNNPHAQPTVSSKRIYSEPSPRSEHLVALEGDLRRMLNLDSLS